MTPLQRSWLEDVQRLYQSRRPPERVSTQKNPLIVHPGSQESRWFSSLVWSVLPPQLQAIPGTPCKVGLEGADRPSAGIFYGIMRGQEMKEWVAQKKI